jgi:outer membrane protein assembly factor BamB
MQLLENSGSSAEMGGFSDAVKQALGTWPLASNAAQLQSLAQLLNELSGLITDRQAADEASAIDVWIQESQPAPEILALVKRRSERLRKSEEAGVQALETARAFARQNDWEANERLLKEIIGRQELKRTASYQTAKRELESIDSIRGQQKAWESELQQAMLHGDKERSLALAQRMGLRYLPFVVQSKPAGCEIVRSGQVIGITPFIMDIPAGERADLELTIQKKGFDARTVLGSAAEGGWFMKVDLERTNSGFHNLNMTLTARPIAINGRLWVASRQQGAVITPGKNVERFAFENAGTSEIVGQPLYANAVAAEDGIYFATRDNVAIRLSKVGVERLGLPQRSDFALAIHTSELIVGRRYLITAGNDQILYASDAQTSALVWRSTVGAPFSCAPAIMKDRIVIARANGVCAAYLPDDGKMVASYQLDNQILSAWQGDGLLHMVTFTSYYRFNGQQPPERIPLPQEAKHAGQGVFISPDNRSYVLNQQTWTDVGKCEFKPTGISLAWMGHAVVPCGTTMAIIGPRGFTLNNQVEFLSPALVNDQLALVTLDGQVRFYSP